MKLFRARQAAAARPMAARVLPLLLGALLVGPVHAQQQAGSDSLFSRAEARFGGQGQTGLTSTTTMTAGVLLDAPVSRSAYRLGPGDIVTVSLTGERSQVHTAMVTPEGTILIPTVGVVPLLGLNLDEAESIVRREVLRFYRSVEVRLTLDQLRTFKVYVVGNVPNAGVRTASPATRVSEVVPATDAEGRGYRDILLRRPSGDSLRIDLVAFFQTGDLGMNPTLLAGDIIVLPVRDETVQVFGQLAYPGAYAYRPGESLADLLRIASGASGFPSDAADSVRLTRFRDATDREVFNLSRAEATGTVGEALELQPFDAIYVAAVSNFKRQQTATVLGQVRRPGVYPIMPGTTTIRELVRLAGGFTEEASLIDATLRRRPRELYSDSTARRLPAELLTEVERQILQIETQGAANNVVVDFRAVFANGENVTNQALENGDVLFVPERRDEVIVLGAVAQPGIVTYTPGQPLSYFVTLAGGYSGNADAGDVMVLKAKLGNRLHWRDVTVIEPGDRIVVPFKQPRTALQRLQTVQGVITTISGFVLTIVGLERLWDTIGS